MLSAFGSVALTVSTNKGDMMIVVSYETLSGNVVKRKFDDWQTAQEFADKKQEQSNIQWVDVEAI